ncbi:pentapeptide repeat-containing protein [Streptomyces sp. NPDC088557]|uniref:pentapeptide repeat-containing protein n=1 Tax=Streptomyces sp. NPDC088557 TaxID=3365867 RepID=UPI00380F361A
MTNLSASSVTYDMGQSWPKCGHGADPTADTPAGCQGRVVEPYSACLAHLEPAHRSDYLAGLAPGADLYHQGTPFTELLLKDLMDAVRDLSTSHPLIGTARFDGATFTGIASFENATFAGEASFHQATFAGLAWFHRATFDSTAWFPRATFGHTAWFREATFNAVAGFHHVTFSGITWFLGANFTKDAWFSHSSFETASQLGPLVCAGSMDLEGAAFGRPVTIEASALRLSCWRTRWVSTAALRLRYATVDLSDAVLEYPVSLSAHPTAFTLEASRSLTEASLSGADARVQIASLRGVDAAHLSLTDIDLTSCLFTGTIHLDQLKLEGLCRWLTAPTGLKRSGWRLAWWTPRRTLAEEHHWRTARGYSGWTAPQSEQEHVPGVAALTPIYRQLRKAFEDGKNEPDAGDFYYGEMEMRRRNSIRPMGERWLLTLYWAISGYGLRAARALAWLGVAATSTLLTLMLWGLPIDDPKPEITGRLVPSGQKITLITDTPAPVNPTGSLAERINTDRFEKALRVVINSVVFRSSGQNLTTFGTYAEMVSRITEPVLLGLAVLAVRSRVKR